MRELEKEIKGTGDMKGFTFKQIHSSPCAYVYEISDGNGILHYETFLRKELEDSQYTIAGNTIYSPAHVKYPKTEDFGKWAWSIREYERALSLWEELNTTEKEK